MVFEPNYASKMRTTDRIFVLEKGEGATKDSKGLIDNRLFTGENKLHAKQDNGLWSLAYDDGIIPKQLNQNWTSFAKLKEYVTQYFNRRNINVKEILD